MKKNLRRFVSAALLVAVLMGFAVPASATVLPMCLTWHGGSLLDTKTESVVGFGTDRSVYYIKAESEVEITLAPGFDGVLQKAYILVAGTSDRIYYFDSSKDAYFAGISIPFTTGTTAEGKSINLSDPSKIYVLIAEATGADGDITQQSFFRVVNEINGEYVINDEAAYTNPLIVKSGLDYDSVILRDDGYFEIEKDGKYGLLDKNGVELVPPVYDWLGEISDGMVKAYQERDYSSKYGFVDISTGELTIPFQYREDFEDESASDFSNGYAVIMRREETRYRAPGDMFDTVDITTMCGLIDKTGNMVIPLSDIEIAYTTVADYDLSLEKEKWSRIYDFSDNRVVAKKGDKWVVMDTQGNVLFEPEFSEVQGYHNGFAIVRNDKNLKYGFIDTQGNVIVQPKYDEVENFYSGYAVVKSGNHYGAIDKEGKLVVPTKYDHMGCFFEGLACVGTKVSDDSYHNLKYGYVNTRGELVIPTIYDANVGRVSGAFHEGLAKVALVDERFSDISSSQCKFGYIDKQGNVVIPIEYSHAESFSNGIALVETGSLTTHHVSFGYEEFDVPVETRFRELGIEPEYKYIDTAGNVILSADTPFPYGTERYYVDKINGTYAIMRNPIYRETATPNRSTVLVNGEKVAFDAYTINQNNYFKLRDLAKVLSGTGKQFEVTWDGSNNAINMLSGKPYTTVGGELAQGDGANKTATVNTATVYLDGQPVSLLAYTINQNNYFKLRDVGQAFDFDVTWDGVNNTIVIDTTQSYTAD